MLILAHHGVESLIPAALGASALGIHYLRARLAMWTGRRPRSRTRLGTRAHQVTGTDA